MKRLLILSAVLVLLVAPQFVFGTDLDDLKAVNEKAIKAWNTLDAAGLASLLHPGVVAFDRDLAFATVAPMENTQEAMRANYETMFATYESIKVTYVDWQYRVVGNTGIAWGYWTADLKPKDGPARTIQARGTYTWVKSGGKWLLLMGHASALPSGD